MQAADEITNPGMTARIRQSRALILVFSGEFQLLLLVLLTLYFGEMRPTWEFREFR